MIDIAVLGVFDTKLYLLRRIKSVHRCDGNELIHSQETFIRHSINLKLLLFYEYCNSDYNKGLTKQGNMDNLQILFVLLAQLLMWITP